MHYFITGGTGFIGTHLVGQLLKRRNATLHVLVRGRSEGKVKKLRERFGVPESRLQVVKGDIRKPLLGLDQKALASLKGKIHHFFHLAAVYNILDEDEAEHVSLNVEGTRNAVEAAEALEVKCFHHMSSMAAAGLYRGLWREDMFEEAEGFKHPYFQTKHDAESVVRYECKRPYRIYRPSIVIGDSESGETTKPDGPYYVFKLLQRSRTVLPPWMPLIGIEGGELNIVPVDYVVKAMDFLAHKANLNGETFHLGDPNPYRTGKVLNVFAKAAHSPQFALRIDSRLLAMVPTGLLQTLLQIPPIQRIYLTLLHDLGLPSDFMNYLNYPTRFDCHDTVRELKGSGVECPRLDDYAFRIWDYWERNLDPDLFRDRTLKGAVKGKVVLITGGSSGIGRAAANKVAAAGATTIIVARTKERLDETVREIEARGGKVFSYVADLSEMDACDAMLDKVFKDHGHVDILVNNAGRSIRRSVHNSLDRFHDYERTMQLNYFAPVRLVLGVLPHMVKNGGGQVINISSIGVLANTPRFSAYVSSKAALDAFARCARAEYLDDHIHFTTINMPLVRTPMINPTGLYNHVPALLPDEAADMVVQAIIEKPKRIASRLGIFAQVMHTLLPNVTDVIMNTAFKLFPESRAAQGGDSDASDEPSAEAVAFAALMRGIHW